MLCVSFTSSIIVLLFFLAAIDISPAQNSLLEIKLAAIKCLEYEEYLQLLGLASVEDRCVRYH